MEQMISIILKATWQTLYMVVVSTTIAVILGFIPAVILTLTAEDGLKPNKVVYGILDVIVNVFRSFPFVILMIIVIPVTRILAGSSIGTTAAIVPLTIYAVPFIARVFENALRETDPGVIEAAKSFGATDMQIIFRVYFKESVPRIINGIVLLIINMVGASAMAGTLGGGVLGDVAIRKGYQGYDINYLIVMPQSLRHQLGVLRGRQAVQRLQKDLSCFAGRL